MSVHTTTVEILDGHDVLEVFVRSFSQLLTIIVQYCYLKGFKTIQAFHKEYPQRALVFGDRQGSFRLSHLSYFDLIVVFILLFTIPFV